LPTSLSTRLRKLPPFLRTASHPPRGGSEALFVEGFVLIGFKEVAGQTD